MFLVKVFLDLMTQSVAKLGLKYNLDRLGVNITLEKIRPLSK